MGGSGWGRAFAGLGLLAILGFIALFVTRMVTLEGGKTLEVNVRVEDPGAFTMPWNAIQRYHRVEPGVAENKDALNPISSSADAGPMLEVACAENNDVRFFGEGALPIPQAGKPDF